MTSFTGGAANARVYAFRLEPEGAGFALADETPLDGIGGPLTRDQLLEPLVEPGVRIAAGFGDAAGGASVMLPMGLIFSAGEIRDLVEFLAAER